MTTTDLGALLAGWKAAASQDPAAGGHPFTDVATRAAVVQARIEALRAFPPSFDSSDLDVVLAQLYSARRMRRQIIEGNDPEVLVPTLRAFLFDDEPLETKFATYPALIRYAGLPILGELFGWVHPDRYPLYTQRALAALRQLGWSVPARNYPVFNAAFSALRQAYEAAEVRLAPELPLNLELDQFLAWVVSGRERERAGTAGVRSERLQSPGGTHAGAPVSAAPGQRRLAIREYGALYQTAAVRPDECWPDTPLAPPAPEQLAAAEAAIRAQLALPPDIVRRAAVHLVAGRHLILTGAPGTGKSHLAQLLSHDLFGYEPMLVTATAEWSAFDIVGGLVPVMDDRGALTYTIRPGHVYEALRRNWFLDPAGRPHRDVDGRALRRPVDAPGGRARGLWLIIDELNRADADKAFGELFSALESGALRVPRPGAAGTMLMPLPQDFRIIATLNTRDRHYLFTLSDALKRRFAFLELAPPADPSHERAILLRRARTGLVDAGLNPSDENLAEAVDRLLPFAQVVRAFQPLGTAPLLAALRYVGAAGVLAGQPGGVALLDEAVVAEILPQLEGLRELPLALLADLAAGRRGALVPRLERELIAVGAPDSAFQHSLLNLGRALKALAHAAHDAPGIAAAETLLEGLDPPTGPGAETPALIAALRAARAPAERLLPSLAWPLVAAQLEAWLAERRL